MVKDVDPYPEFIRIYSTRDPLSSITNFKILNNTFADERTTRLGIGRTVVFGIGRGSGAGSGNEFRNNLFYGTRDSLNMDGNNSEFVMAFSNNIYPQAQSLDPSGLVGAPALDANFVLTSSDTLALNRGMTLSYFSNDRLGTSRPQGPAWDIGAFEFGNGTMVPPTPTLEAPSNLRLISIYDE